MATIISIKKTWQALIPINSQDCIKKYRKWKPATEGWFCRETDKRCTINKCPFVSIQKTNRTRENLPSIGGHKEIIRINDNI